MDRPAGNLSLTDILFRTPAVGSDQWATLSWPLRWFLMVRGVVLSMTVFAALIGLLAAGLDGAFMIDRALALLVGLTFAHATNNLLNDWIDSRKHVDEGNYFRRRYGVHVLQQGLVNEWAFAVVVVLTGAVAALAGAWLIYADGRTGGWLLAAGAFFVIFYTWPLKHWALGEASVFLVWGPLMIGGGYYVMTGSISAAVLLLSIMYGIGPTLVILGKHIDKFKDDRARGILSLPVAIGERNARRLSIALIFVQLGIWLSVIWLGALAWLWVCAPALIALPGTVKAFLEPHPTERPEAFPDDVWPLWYAAYGFNYSRNFGLLMIVGLVLQLRFG